MAMERRHSELLVKNRLKLVRSLIINEEFLSVLQGEDILTEDMIELIMAEVTKQNKAGKLLDLLVRRGPKAFACFLTALIETKQAGLAMLLEPSLTKKIQSEIQQRDDEEMAQLPQRIAQEQAANNPAQRVEDRLRDVQQVAPPAQASSSSSLNQESLKNEARQQASSNTPGSSQEHAVNTSTSVNQNLPFPVPAVDNVTTSSRKVEHMEVDASEADFLSTFSDVEKFIDEYSKGGSSFMTEDIDKMKHSGLVKNGSLILIYEQLVFPSGSNSLNESHLLCNTVESVFLPSLFDKLGFTMAFSKDLRNPSLQTIIDAVKGFPIPKDTDGLAVIVIASAKDHSGNDGVKVRDCAERKRLINDCINHFTGNTTIPKLFFFQFMVDRGASGMDEVDTVVEQPSLEQNTSLMIIESYDWLCNSKPNLFPWGLIKVFSQSTLTDSLGTILKRLVSFLQTRTKDRAGDQAGQTKEAEIKSVTLKSQLEDQRWKFLSV